MQEIDDKEFRIKLGRKIREFRQSLNLTQEKAAERSLISVDFLAKVEIGYYSPNSLRIVQIANGLEITPNHLLKDFIYSKTMIADDMLLRELNKLSLEDKEILLDLIKYIAKKNEPLKKFSNGSP